MILDSKQQDEKEETTRWMSLTGKIAGVGLSGGIC